MSEYSTLSLPINSCQPLTGLASASVVLMVDVHLLISHTQMI